LPSVFRLDRRFDVATHVKVAFNIHTQRIAGFYKIFENYIDDMLVKNLHVPKRVDVELQALKLDAALQRRILDSDRSEVGKVRKGTDAGKLGNLKLDFDFAAGKLVREGVDRIKLHFLARRRANIQFLKVRRLKLCARLRIHAHNIDRLEAAR